MALGDSLITAAAAIGHRAVATARRERARRRRSSAEDGVSAGDRWLVHQLDAVLGADPGATVAVLVGDEPSSVGDLLTTGYPGAAITIVALRDSEPSLFLALAAAGPFDAIALVESAAPDPAAMYRSVLFHLARGGRLFVADFCPGRPAPEGLWPLLHRLVALKDGRVEVPAANRDESELARATRGVVVSADRLTVTKATRTLPKLREAEADFVLERRGPDFGVVLNRVAAERFMPRGAVFDHAATSVRQEVVPIEVPRLTLREYPHAYCLPGQVVVKDDLLLPDTYRHHLWPRLVNRKTIEVAPRFARLPADPESAKRLEGSYFQWDSEWAGHFGHLLTEQLSRLWAWPAAKSLYPDLRLLLHRSRATDPLAPHELGLLQGFGIDPGDVELISRPVRVERLVAATPMFSMPQYVSPRIESVWDRLAAGAKAMADPVLTPRRIFVSRERGTRVCRNRDEVERQFAAAGFTVVYPEQRGFADQVALFRNAEVVAGFAGSALFTLALCDEPKPVLVLSSEAYEPHNELMISAVRGHRVDIVRSIAEERGVSSRFTFDFDREGQHLRRRLAELAA